MKAEVDKYEDSREFPWEIVLSQAIPFIVELFSRRRALKQRIAFSCLKLPRPHH